MIRRTSQQVLRRSPIYQHLHGHPETRPQPEGQSHCDILLARLPRQFAKLLPSLSYNLITSRSLLNVFNPCWKALLSSALSSRPPGQRRRRWAREHTTIPAGAGNRLWRLHQGVGSAQRAGPVVPRLYPQRDPQLEAQRWLAQCHVGFFESTLCPQIIILRVNGVRIPESRNHATDQNPTAYRVYQSFTRTPAGLLYQLRIFRNT